MYFRDAWDTDFEDSISEQPNSHHQSIQCELLYTCNSGSTQTPMIFQSHKFLEMQSII